MNFYFLCCLGPFAILMEFVLVSKSSEHPMSHEGQTWSLVHYVESSDAHFIGSPD